MNKETLTRADLNLNPEVAGSSPALVKLSIYVTLIFITLCSLLCNIHLYTKHNFCIYNNVLLTQTSVHINPNSLSACCFVNNGT